jgi:hypothetical protein
MGYIAEPPANPQIAAANDYLSVILEAVKLAQATIISRNLRLNGTIAEQEKFALTWSEIRGIAARALAAGTSEAAMAAKQQVNSAVDERVLKNPAYNKFRVGIAGSDDPLLGK